MNTSDFSFQILSLKNETLKKSIATVNEVYFFWKSSWQKSLNELGAAHPNWADEFYRYTHLGLLSYNGTPVSMHLYMVQNLDVNACVQQSQFEIFGTEALEKVKQDGYKKLITGGWLTLNSEFAKNPKKIAFSRLQIALTKRASEYFNCQGIIGPTRKDNGLSERIIEWGASAYGTGMMNNGEVELLVLGNEIQIPLKEAEEEIINHVWTFESDTIKKAA